MIYRYTESSNVPCGRAFVSRFHPSALANWSWRQLVMNEIARFCCPVGEGKMSQPSHQKKKEKKVEKRRKRGGYYFMDDHLVVRGDRGSCHSWDCHHFLSGRDSPLKMNRALLTFLHLTGRRFIGRFKCSSCF